MSTLMDKINNNLAGSQPQTQQQSQTQQAERLLKARSGRATQGGVGGSSLLEDVAQDTQRGGQRQLQAQGAQQAGALQQQGQVQQRQQAMAGQEFTQQRQLRRQEVEQREALALEEIQQREQIAGDKRSAEETVRLNQLHQTAVNQLRQLEASRNVAIDDLFGEYNRSNQELEFRKDSARLEQLAHNLALSDKNYVNQLDMIGREQLLYDDLNFREESQRLILGQQMGEFLEDQNWQKAFNADQRQWKEELQMLDINQAIEMGEILMSEQSQRTMWEGAGGVVSGAISAYGAYEKASEGEAEDKDKGTN